VKNYKNIILWVLSVFAIFVLLPVEDTFDQSIHTEQFCAYGRVYVEFRKSGKVWGTTFIDEFGKPVICNGDLEKITDHRIIS
jgi:hypothetical protein